MVANRPRFEAVALPQVLHTTFPICSCELFDYGLRRRRLATAEQIELIDMVIEHLTEKGAMDPGLLDESPSIDKAPEVRRQVFDFEKTKRLVEVIRGFDLAADPPLQAV
ncbi:type I restriction-modification enzyme R subunit C-terminal domain-containing protein [Aquibium sp. LZ166]|uniref:Type I restriction-modification enzyme R subunit C-terminal domain-containing protein n=1 Tax=Aquibium pacificus TaxID=3153579 RepID=A0ABV3SCW5_9HYPH